jgi:hypothetical protein
MATLLLLAPVVVAAQEDDGVQGEFEVGAWDTSVTGSPNATMEYEPIDGGPILKLGLGSMGENGSFVLDSDVRDSNSQEHLLAFEWKRIIRSVNTYSSLIHRLGHDPLTNLTAATNHGRVVRHTDTDPTAVYDIDYSVFESVTDFQFEGAPGLTLTAGYKRQDREGMKQNLTVSHCDNCHVVSQSRPIDESTEDINLGATYAWLGGTVRASYNARTYEEGVPNITLLFDDALHPELRKPLFDNRLQFDSAEGPQAIDVRPDIEKSTARLGANWTDVGGFAVTADGIWTQTDNETTGLSADYTGYVVTAAKRFNQKWNLRWRGNTYMLDNDDVQVTVNKRPGIAGPQAGGTYYDFYPGAPGDFVRMSALNRDVMNSKFDLGYRFGRRNTLRFLWDWKEVDRDNYEVKPGETTTTTNVVGLAWSGRPKKGTRFKAEYKHAAVDNPFSFVNGGYSTLVSQRVPNPFDPNGAQYYESHAARIADTTANPESWDQVNLRGTFTFGNASLTASYRWWDGDNSDGDLTDWAKTNEAAVLSLFAAQNAHVQWHLMYARHENETDFATSIPIFDG